MIREFLAVYRLYRWHSRAYALRAAWRIAVRGVPF
jgi:hypothetical protein